MMRSMLVVLVLVSVPACAADPVRTVDGGRVDADGWPARPGSIERRFRCPRGADLVDETAPSGRRTVSCKSSMNPLPKGFELSWYADGTLASVARFDDDGVPVSAVTFHRRGGRQSEARYEDGRLRQKTSWYRTGQKRSQMIFVGDDAFDVVRWQTDGSIEEQGKTRAGERVGEWTLWREGALETVRYQEGHPAGEVRRRYPTGDVETGEYGDDGRRTGLWRRVDAHGRPVREVRYDEDGRRHGPFRSWHPNGQVHQEGRWEHGVRHGDWTSWYPSGQKRSERTWACGEKTGVWKSWFASGEPKSQRRFAEGRPVGEWREFNEQGVLVRVKEHAPAPTAEPRIPPVCQALENTK